MNPFVLIGIIILAVIFVKAHDKREAIIGRLIAAAELKII